MKTSGILLLLVCSFVGCFFSMLRKDIPSLDNLHFDLDKTTIFWNNDTDSLFFTSITSEGESEFSRSLLTPSNFGITRIKTNSDEMKFISGDVENEKSGYIVMLDSEYLVTALKLSMNESMIITDLDPMNGIIFFCGYNDLKVNENRSFIGAVNQLDEVEYFVRTNTHKNLQILNTTNHSCFFVISQNETVQAGGLYDIIISKVYTSNEEYFSLSTEWSRLLLYETTSENVKFVVFEDTIFFCGKNGSDYVIGKILSSGSLEWALNIHQSLSLSVVDLSVGPENVVYATGTYSETSVDFFVMKVDGTNGAILFSNVYLLPSNEDDEGDFLYDWDGRPVSQRGMGVFVTKKKGDDQVIVNVVGEISFDDTSYVSFHGIESVDGKLCKPMDISSILLPYCDLYNDVTLLEFDFLFIPQNTSLIEVTNETEAFEVKNSTYTPEPKDHFFCYSCFEIDSTNYFHPISSTPPSFEDIRDNKCTDRKYPLFVMSYGHSNFDSGTIVLRTKVFKQEDHGRIVVLGRETDGSSYWYATLTIFRNDGVMEDEYRFRPSNGGHHFWGAMNSMSETSDGDFLFGIDVISVGYSHQLILFNTSSREIEISGYFTSGGHDVMSFAAPADGGDSVLMAGRSAAFISNGYNNLAIIKARKDGSVALSLALKDNRNLDTSGLMELEGGDVLVTVTETFGCLQRLKGDGSSVVWGRRLDNDHYFRRLLEDKDDTNDIFWCGEFIEGATRHFLYGRVSSDGTNNVFVKKIQASAGRTITCHEGGVIATSANQIIIFGTTNEYTPEEVGFVMEIDKLSGGIEWARIFNFSVTAKEVFVRPYFDSVDNSVYVAGRTKRNEGRDDDALLRKMDGEDLESSCEAVNATSEFVSSLVPYTGQFSSRVLSIQSFGTSLTNNGIDVSSTPDMIVHSRKCECYGFSWVDTSNVCNGNGRCDCQEICEDNLSGECICRDKYHGHNCSIFSCFGVLSNTSEACGDEHGVCVDADTCECFSSEFGGKECDEEECFGIIQSDYKHVCSGHGVCDYPVCKCNESYFGEICNITTCFGVLSNLSDVVEGCSDHGNCEKESNVCECTSPSFYGAFCNITECFGIIMNDSNSCGENGTCIGLDQCSCDQGVYGKECELYTCFGVPGNETIRVCSGHGNCSSSDVCRCTSPLYYGDFCNNTYCFGIMMNDSESCGENGTCIGFDQCSCDQGMYGKECDVYSCFGVIGNETFQVCSGHGNCTSTDVCECTSPLYYGDFCNFTECFGIMMNDSNSCGENGTCVELDKCLCDQGVYGEKCDAYTCFGVPGNETFQVCSGHGKCIDTDVCECSFGFEGTDSADSCSLRKYPLMLKSFGRDSHDYSGKVIRTKTYMNESGGRIVVAGRTLRFGAWSITLFFFRVDEHEMFVEEFNTQIALGDPVNEQFTLDHGSISETDEGNILIGVGTLIYGSGYSHYVALFNTTTMKVEWSVLYTSHNHDVMRKACPSDDGNSVITSGRSAGFHPVSRNTHSMIKTRKDGTLVWGRALVHPTGNLVTLGMVSIQKDGSQDVISSVYSTEDNLGYIQKMKGDGSSILWGFYLSVAGYHFQTLFEDLDSGDVFWCGSHGDELMYGRISTADGSPVFTKIVSVSGGKYYMCIEHGGIVSTKIDNEIVFVVTTNEYSDEEMGLLFKIEKTTGDVIWGRSFDETLAVKESFGIPFYDETDHTILLVGDTDRNSKDFRGLDILLSKVDGYLGTNCETLDVTSELKSSISDYGGVWVESFLLIESFTPLYYTHDTLQFDNVIQTDYIKFCECQSVDIRDPSICNFKNGSCNTQTGRCECRDHYYGSDCSIYECFSSLSNDTSEVCYGHGKCIDFDSCSCEDTFVPPYCGYNKTCNDIFYLNSSVCSGGHGVCVSEDYCECFYGYHGSPFCSEYNCFGILPQNKSSVCSGRGDCVDRNECECEEGSFSETCNVTTCFDYLSNDTLFVCSGRGDCMERDECDCNTTIHNYHGGECQYWECFGVSVSKEDEVCGGHGVCNIPDNCECEENYENQVSVDINGPCTVFSCDGIGNDKSNMKQICNGHGFCRAVDTCECSKGYESRFCEDYRCNYILYSQKKVCNGHGVCKSPETCECEKEYFGEFCEFSVVLVSVLSPVISLTFLSFIVCASLICCVVCYVSCICCMGCSCLCISVLKLTRKNRKFGKLENIDILLSEQEMEKDRGLDHVQINKKLFEIDYEELKVEKILGEGGSNSVVYLAKWKRKKVAYKCFKTRQLFSSQESFDEFEREVQVLASVNHPHVINFYGCCLKPPRVGIIMEFASNGDITVFLSNYSFENDKERFPIEEKLRILFEVSTSLDYIHSRSIIHRDLKCENVLLDDQLRAKLMDFGLSRIIDNMSVAKTVRVGTSIYMSPEIVINDRYTESCDVYSFAIMCWVVITENFSPYGGEEIGIELKVAQSENFRPSLDELEECLVKEGVKDSKNHESNDYRWVMDLIKVNWKHDPSERMSFSSISTIFENNLKTSGKNKYSSDEGGDKTENNSSGDNERERKSDDDDDEDEDEEKEEEGEGEESGERLKEMESLFQEFCEQSGISFDNFLKFKKKKNRKQKK